MNGFLGCVDHIVSSFLRPALRGIVDGSHIIYAGSHYEHSALNIPSNSDFDLQFPLTLRSRPQAESSDRAGQMKVKGGPKQFLDDEGYLCSYKVLIVIK